MSRTLADIVSLVRGNTYDGKLVGEPGVALLGLGSIKPGGGFRRDGFNTFGGESPDKISLKPGDLYVALKEVVNDGSMLGSVARLPPDIPKGRLTQDTVKLVFQDASEQLRAFVYWWLQTPQYRRYCGAHSTGTTTMALQRNDFLAYPVAEPTEEQFSLAQRLDDIEELQSVLAAQNQTLEDLARAIFKSWFIDFDAVNAKAEGRSTGLPPEIDALFPSGFEETEAGKVPEGWKHGTLVDVATLNPEAWTAKTLPAHVDYLDLAGVKRGKIEEHQTVSDSSIPSRARRILKSGDTIVGTVRPANGSYAMVNRDGYTGSTAFAVLRPHDNARAFTYLAATSPDAIERLAQLADGAAYPAVRPGVVSDTPVIVPESTLLAAFEAVVSHLLERRALNDEQCETLSKLRDTLLPRLISGRLHLPVEVTT